MSETRDGGQAFPYGDYTHGGEAGMTLRDWFAGQALAGIASSGGYGFSLSLQQSAGWAYQYADAMLAARDATHDRP